MPVRSLASWIGATVAGVGEFVFVTVVVADAPSNFGIEWTVAQASIHCVGSLVAKNVAVFFLADLAAIFGVFEEKGEIGVEFKVVVGIEKLVFEEVTFFSERGQLEVEVAEGAGQI